MVEGAQDFILGHFQPSLAGLATLVKNTQDCILGYSQSSLRDSIQQRLVLRRTPSP